MRTPHSGSLHRSGFALLAPIVLAGMLSGLPASVQGQELIPPKTTIRKFPEGFFCPIPLDLRFTSDGAEVTLHFSGNVYVNNSGTPTYTNQALDNIFIVKAEDFVPPNVVDNEGDYNTCYAGAPLDSLFLFDRPGLTFPFSDLFDTAPAAGWDLSGGAYYDGARSGHRNPSSTSGHDGSGGCLGLGVALATPTLPDTGIVASTSIVISGLTAGHDYYVVGWWDVLAGVFLNSVRLTAEVTGGHNTVLSKKTWGGLKSRYR